MKALVSAYPLAKRVWDSDTFSSLTIMGMRVGMLTAKFLLSIFMARYMGLEELGIYGLIVGASGIVQAVMRGGIFALLSRDAVNQSLAELTHHLRHYGTGVLCLYTLFVPVTLATGWYLDAPGIAMLALAVFLTEHLAFDTFVLINNLQYPKLANFVYSLQSAIWIYLFIGFAFFYPSLRSIDTLLLFWVSGGFIALVIAIWLSRGWPWGKAFARKIEWQWYVDKIKRSLKLYIADVIGVVNYYLDRYLVTLFLSLEMTGVYVFFSQVVTATWNLINSGVMVVYRPRLIKLYDCNNVAPFNEVFKECVKRTFSSTFALAMLVGLTVPFMVRFTDNAELLNHIPLLWIMLLALLFRMGETAASGALFAMHKDREYFVFNIIGFFLTAIVGSIGVMMFGVFGVVFNTITVAIISMIYARIIWDKKPSLATGREGTPVSNDDARALALVGSKIPDLRRRKILIISSIFCPHIFGGAEVAAYNRAKLLAKRGHDVSVATLHEKNTSPSWGEMMPERFKLYRIKAPRKYTLYERTRNIPLWTKALWHFQDYFDRRNQKLVSSLLDEVQPDHIFVDNLIGFGFNVLSEIGRRNVPVTYMLHDLNLACFNTGMIRKGRTCERQCGSCRLVGSLRQTPLRKVPRLGFVSPSLANLERARKFVPVINRSLSSVIRNVPEELPQLPERKGSDHIRLLFVGRLDPVKGVKFLLQVLDVLSDDYRFHLTVLGTGPSEGHLKAEYGQKEWVTFRGFVPGNEVSAALVEHDLYCIPSLVAESYGLVTAQALQLGTPVIGSNEGGTAELVRDGVTGILAPPGDEKAWREAFIKIFSNPELLAIWHDNASRHASEFDENVIGQAYEEFTERLFTSLTLRA